MKKLVIGLAAALSLTTSASFAATLTGSFTVGEAYSYANGGANISNNLSTPFTIALTPNVATAPVNFFTLAPNGGVSGGTQCTGGGCNTGTHTESDAITVTFSHLTVMGMTLPNEIESGTFSAKYTGTILDCAKGDGRSPASGQTDCMMWSGASSAYNGSTTDAFNLGNGYQLDITLYNATDWNVTPRISFELQSVPEPTSLALLGGGLAGIGFLRRRRKAA